MHISDEPPEETPGEEPKSQELVVDIAGLVLLVIVLLTWIGIATFAFVSGDVSSLFDPADSYGQKCGIDVLVEHKPVLMYFDITECVDAGAPIFGCDPVRVCTEECPVEIFLASRKEDRENGFTFCRKGSLKWDNYDCASWYLASIPYRGRCIPVDVPSDQVLQEISNVSQKTIDRETMTRAIRNIKSISDITSGTRYFMLEVVQKWWAILCVALIVLFVCVGYFCIFSVCPKGLFLISVVSVPGLLGLSLYFGVSQYIKLDRERDSTEFTHDKKYIWLALSIVLGVAAFFLICMTLFWIRETFNGIALIKICSSKLKDMFIIVVVAVICWVLHILFFVFFVSVFIYLGNISEPSGYRISMDKSCRKYLSAFDPHVDVAACDPDFVQIRSQVTNETDCKKISCEIIPSRTISYVSLQFFNTLFYVWMVFFLFALQELIIGLLIYSRQESKISYSEALRHTATVCKCYLGTAFVGSALIALMKYVCLKILLIWTARKSGSSKAMSRFNTCLRMGILIEMSFGVIDTQILIVCLLYNKNFWYSSKIFRKMVKPEAQHRLQHLGSIYYILFYQKLLVTLICSIIAYLYVTYLDYTPSAYSFLILFFTMFLSFATVSILFSIYTVILDVLVISLFKHFEQYRVQDEDIISALLSE